MLRPRPHGDGEERQEEAQREPGHEPAAVGRSHGLVERLRGGGVGELQPVAPDLEQEADEGQKAPDRADDTDQDRQQPLSARHRGPRFRPLSGGVPRVFDGPASAATANFRPRPRLVDCPTRLPYNARMERG